MKKNVIFFIVCCFAIIMIFMLLGNMNTNKQDNNNDVSYELIKFDKLDIKEEKLDRYNELINIPQVSFLIRNLPSVLKSDSIVLEMLPVYCYNYAEYFNNDGNDNIIQNNGNTYINCDYMKNIVYELFNQNIDISKYTIKDNYILIDNTSVVTDTITLEIEDILYNEQYNLYKIIIKEYEYNIEIIYKYNDGKYVLLWCE